MIFGRYPDWDIGLLFILRRIGDRMIGECGSHVCVLRCLKFRGVFSLKNLLTGYVLLKKLWTLKGFLRRWKSDWLQQDFRVELQCGGNNWNLLEMGWENRKSLRGRRWRSTFVPHSCLIITRDWCTNDYKIWDKGHILWRIIPQNSINFW